ncbi:MAG: acyltransferase family protein [Pseudomonadales bacterium]|nr:acyltransferase family protein [Pseudomonadales bacterium]
MDNQTSDLIRALRLTLIMGLVLVHFGNFPQDSLSPFAGVVAPKHFIPASINSFFLYFFLSSVPILSIISGYLFSISSDKSYTTLLLRKTRTIVIPSILWTSLWLIFAFLLYTIGKSFNQFVYFNYGFNNFSVTTLLNGVLGIYQPPFAFQFWFIHDLILSLLMTPLLGFVIGRLPLAFFCSLILLWIVQWQPPLFDNLKVITFFSVGIFLGQRHWQPRHLSWMPFFIPFFIALILLRIYVPYYNQGIMPFESTFELILRSSGCIAQLSLIYIISHKFPAIFKWLVDHSSYAFFIFAAHFPLVLLVKNLLFRSGFFTGSMGQTLLWMITPGLTIALIIIMAYCLSQVCKPVYLLLNGQRDI